MFKTKRKYQVVFADGHTLNIEGYHISVLDDDNDPSKGDVYIEADKRGNDCAWFRKENLKYIVTIG